MIALPIQLPENALLAASLREYANLLQQQDADGFRVAAYRRAADVVEGLEMAAYDGCLEQVAGFGARRAQMVRAALAERLGRPRLRQMRQMQEHPPVSLLLDVDREYREKAHSGELRKIAPKRFNPTGEAWLSHLHSRRERWEFTAFFSNTRLAHELGRTRDWVVIYDHTESSPEAQCTVVTETHGPMTGRRVVRGREEECRAVADSADRTAAGQVTA